MVSMSLSLLLQYLTLQAQERELLSWPFVLEVKVFVISKSFSIRSDVQKVMDHKFTNMPSWGGKIVSEIQE